MIGQNKLISKIDFLSLQSFPSSSLFIGPSGCGKHTIVSHIGSKFNLPVVEVEKVSLDFVNSVYTNPNPCLYLFDLSKLSFSDQNTLLKLVEEPPTLLCFISENGKDVLPTIKNRCTLFEFDIYTDEELRNFLIEGDNESLVFKAARTPGQILRLNRDTLEDMFQLADTIIEKISVANFANALTIADKFNYNGEEDKFDVDVFFNILSSELFDFYCRIGDPKIKNMFSITQYYRSKISYKKLSLKYLIGQYIIDMWESSHNGT